MLSQSSVHQSSLKICPLPGAHVTQCVCRMCGSHSSSMDIRQGSTKETAPELPEGGFIR